MNFEVPYAITRRLENVSFADARQRTVAALASEGFGVLTEIDVQKTLREKLGAELPPYVILGACNPQLAHRAITREPAIGLLLPCNVVVAEDGTDVVVSAASPHAMFAAVQHRASVADVAEDAEQRLRRAIAKV